MTRGLQTMVFALAGALSLALAAPAQNSAPPVPAQLLHAHSVFVSNGGNSCNWFAGPNVPYSGLYTALQHWGRYSLASAPAQADLVFSVSFSCPDSGYRNARQFADLRLKILQPQPRILLWTLNEPVQSALLQSSRDHNLDAGVAALVHDLQSLDAGLPVSEQRPKLRPNWLPIAIVAAAAVVVTVIFVIARHHLQDQMPTPPPIPVASGRPF